MRDSTVMIRIPKFTMVMMLLCWLQREGVSLGQRDEGAGAVPHVRDLRGLAPGEGVRQYY